MKGVVCVCVCVCVCVIRFTGTDKSGVIHIRNLMAKPGRDRSSFKGTGGGGERMGGASWPARFRVIALDNEVRAQLASDPT